MLQVGSLCQFKLLYFPNLKLLFYRKTINASAEPCWDTIFAKTNVQRWLSEKDCYHCVGMCVHCGKSNMLGETYGARSCPRTGDAGCACGWACTHPLTLSGDDTLAGSSRERHLTYCILPVPVPRYTVIYTPKRIYYLVSRQLSQ